MDDQSSPQNNGGSAAAWLCHLLLVACSLLVSGIYYPTTIHYSFPYLQAIVFLVAAIISAAVALRKLEFPLNGRSIPALLIALLIFVAVMPWPYRLAGILLALGLVLTWIDRQNQTIRPVANGLLFSGLIIGIQTLLLPSYYLFFSRFHRLDFATPLLTVLFKAMGVEATTSAGALFIREGDKVFSFLTTWDSLGLFPLLNLWIAGLLTIWLFRLRWTKLLHLSVILLAYLFLRYAAAIFFFLNLQNAAVLWKHEFTLLTLLPLIVILPRLVPLQLATCKLASSSHSLFSPVSRRRLLPVTAAMSLLIFSLAGVWGFDDPGLRKAGRILIDEKHSNWEWTTEEFDTKWYGEKSTYNYYSLFEHLQRYYTVNRSHQVLTDTLLQDYDVLFIKTPTEPFAENEISAVTKFVRHGGGLFLVGDHTNVFGITTNLNPLAQRFGLRFRYDFQSDISGELSVYERPKILPHPVVQYMPAFMFASGCMLEAPLTAENMMIGYGQRSLYLDYAEKNFFPREKMNEETMEFGLFVQAAGVRYGKGRVLGFTDSTVWSNFYMHIPGKPELLLGCMEWLNRRNSRWEILHKLFLIAAIATLLKSASRWNIPALSCRFCT